MPIPTWMAKVNKHIFNKLELKRGKRPVLTHVGRSSGKTYHTPLDAHRTEDAFIFFAMYGANSDWVQNILAAGTAALSVDGVDYDLVSPRMVTLDDARRQLPPDTELQPGRVGGIEYLQMDIDARQSSG